MNNNQTIKWLRIFNGFSLVIYYILVIIPSWNDFFSTSSGISPILFEYYPKSPLFLIWENDLLKYAVTIFTAFSLFFYMIGIYPRIFHCLAFIGHISLHLANPFIIHEPQQLNNLLLILMFFLPLSGEEGNNTNKNVANMLTMMKIYIGVYYCFAALKKVPDHHWLDGSAVGLICSWTYLAKNNFLNQICQNHYVSIFLTYFTLFFELSFLPLSFSKYRKYLIVCGFLLHTGIGLTLNVGLFFWSMVMWYPLLLNKSKSS